MGQGFSLAPQACATEPTQVNPGRVLKNDVERFSERGAQLASLDATREQAGGRPARPGGGDRGSNNARWDATSPDGAVPRTPRERYAGTPRVREASRLLTNSEGVF